ncbi:MAG: hypothetical protein WBA23_24195 [Tunicatimonas sp.]|uniref:hypothetical protein n=1 Tax=Tunicatimonas sp. TaxID=1940096 RepID=UPI003C77EFC6
MIVWTKQLRNGFSTLEAVLGEFIVQTNKSLKRVEEGTLALQREMVGFKEEMQLDRQQREMDVKDFRRGEAKSSAAGRGDERLQRKDGLVSERVK